MKKLLILFSILFFAFFMQISTSANTIEKDLAYAENQIFEKTYKKDDVQTRLERLELAVYGAVQSGEKENRIMYLKRAVTSVSKGGNGLNNNSKFMDLVGATTGNYNWSIGYGNNYYPHRRNSFKRYPYCSSHRLSPRHYHSHRVHHPRHYNYNGNPAENENYMNNYSMSTSIKILDD